MSISVPSSAAVLVIDVQSSLFDASRPPLEAELVLARINVLTSRARAIGLPAYFVQHDGSAEDNLLPLSEGWQLDPRLVRQPRDIIIRKTTCDAFFETALENELRSRGVDTLIVAGYATEFCIDSTVRNACSKGFRVFVASDAHTTNDSPVLNADKIRQQHNWAWANSSAKPGLSVVPIEDLLFTSPVAPSAES
jgi:nicotinamidase-related amidase